MRNRQTIKQTIKSTEYHCYSCATNGLVVSTIPVLKYLHMETPSRTDDKGSINQTRKHLLLSASRSKKNMNKCSDFRPITGRTTGWPKKVSHYRESLLNRIRNRQPGKSFHQF